MPPEPIPEPMEQNLNAPNLIAGVRPANESDSEDEDAGMAGYMPLSQVPIDSDPMMDDDDDDDDDEVGSNYAIVKQKKNNLHTLFS